MPEESLIMPKPSDVQAKTQTETQAETENKIVIPPGKRWLMIAEEAYALAQRRGFVGGDPFQDWKEAEAAVDSRYQVDVGGMFSQTDADKIAEQLKDLFGSYGLGHLGLDDILDNHKVELEKLAASNRRMVHCAADLASQQNALFQEAVTGAVDIFHSFSRGRVNSEDVNKQMELSKKAMENVLSCFNSWTSTLSGRGAKS